MKKLVALAVAGAFIAPVYADITLSGSQDFSYQDYDGSTLSELDGTLKLTARGEAAGMKVTAVIAINESGETEPAGTGITLAGSFGSVAMGDQSGALDAIDDITDFTIQMGCGSTVNCGSSTAGGQDAHVLWTLPTIAEGLVLRASASADTADSSTLVTGTDDAGTGFSATYSMGAFKVGAAMMDYEDATQHQLVNAQATFSGVTVGYEVFTDTSAAGVDVDAKAMGVTYAMGDITLGFENTKVTTGTTTSYNYTTIGVHYAASSDLKFYFESHDDSQTTGSQASALGVRFAF